MVFSVLFLMVVVSKCMSREEVMTRREIADMQLSMRNVLLFARDVVVPGLSAGRTAVEAKISPYSRTPSRAKREVPFSDVLDGGKE